MLLRIPHIGVGFGLRHLARSGHPTLTVLLLVIVIVALVMANKNRPRR